MAALDGNTAPNTLARQEVLDQSRQGWMQHQGPVPQYSPTGRHTTLPIYTQQQQQQQGPSVDVSYESRNEQEAANAALVHQQEQRGVSQLQNAVTAATNGSTGRGQLMQISPNSGPPATLAQQASQVLLPGQQADMKRGPVEFNHAISYVNKIKVSLLYEKVAGCGISRIIS